jgi:CheY-like chemotaxis protein
MADSVPHVDGFELIQHLRLSPLNAGIPIVMLTCGDVIDTMRRGFKAGVTFFAVKPSNRERFFHLFNAVRGAMENERRRHHRLPYRTPVTCALGDQGKNRFVAESVDISGGGMSVRPSGGAEVGQILELEFLMPQISRPVHPAVTPKSQKVPFAERDIPAAAPQKVHARVCYVAPSGESMGLDFQDLTPKQSDAIGHYILGGS